MVTGCQISRVLSDAVLRPIYVGTVKSYMLYRHNLGNVLASLQHNDI